MNTDMASHWVEAMLNSPALPADIRAQARRAVGLEHWRPGDGLVSSAEIKVIDALAKASGDPLAGARVGLSLKPFGGSVLSYICMCCNTLGEIFESITRYIRITRPDVEAELISQPDELVFRYSNTDPRVDIHKHHSELMVGAAINLLREATGGRTDLPKRVEFAHLRSADRRELAHLYGCEVEFGTEKRALVIDKAMRDMHLVGKDRELHAHLTSYAELILPQRKRVLPGLRQEIETLILPELSLGVPHADDVAEKMGLHPRSLRRRLANEGLSDRVIVDDLRRVLAEEYLEDRGFSLVEIALLLGFSDHSSFAAAYRR
ncbi:MAG: AraC family transcriptional regulator ligand-binding domain-containing protein, partial [Mangrovicoccus sp.]|nr:AraC family transcriptional regulator ligand-binding domain-containing protein [Mangrovicoccus sp.]